MPLPVESLGGFDFRDGGLGGFDNMLGGDAQVDHVLSTVALQTELLDGNRLAVGANLTHTSPTPLTDTPVELLELLRSTGFRGRASCSTSSSTSSAPASLTRCEMTFCVEICPSPMAANTAAG